MYARGRVTKYTTYNELAHPFYKFLKFIQPT
jgi:hypothetical protein